MEMLSSGAALSLQEALKSGTQDDLTEVVAASGLKTGIRDFRWFSGRFGVSNFRWYPESFRFFLIMQEREREKGGGKEKEITHYSCPLVSSNRNWLRNGPWLTA